MQMITYTNTSDTRKLEKALTQRQSFTVSLKNDTDIMRPVVELAGMTLPPNANYAYIQALGRYYYIESTTIMPGKITSIQLRCDVLMSFKDTIKNSYVIASRSTSRANKSLVDVLPISSKRNLIYKLMHNGSSVFGSDKLNTGSRCYLLTVATGGV